MRQGLLILRKHLSSPPIFGWVPVIHRFLLLFYYVSVGSEFRVVLSATVTGNVGSVVSLLEFVSNCNVE